MTKKRIHRERKQTAEQLSREKTVRETLQRERPGLKEILATGEYEAPVLQGDYYNAMRLLAELKHWRERKKTQPGGHFRANRH